jgi:hypothetical protein
MHNKKFKYVCPVEFYPNCRTHDGGFYHHIEFFTSLKELIKYAFNNKNDFEITSIYSIKGNIPNNIKLEYDLGYHKCNGLVLKVKNNIFRTVDNGKGVLKWTKLV